MNDPEKKTHTHKDRQTDRQCIISVLNAKL